jgi:recombination protein RecR
MAEYIAPIQRLIEEFRRLPGVGGKSAARYAFAMLEFSEEDAARFADAIIGAKRDVHTCPICQGLCTEEVCAICKDESRDSSLICVVENAKDVMVMERVRGYRGTYHVLGGALAPLDNVTPDKLKIKELLARIEEGDVKEIIIATNPTVEGEATAMYLSRLLKPFDIKITRLAYGIPVGSDLEYADEVTLYRAIEGRRDI